MAWLFVRGMAVSNSGCGSPSDPPIAPSVTSKGKPMPPASWWRAWKTAPWIQRLSGTTLPPSMANRGVASWIASLRDSRASHSVLLENAARPTTSDGYGPASPAFFAQYDPATSSWRTSQASFLEGLNTYSQTWPRSGSLHSGTVSARPTWVLRTAVNVSSSSEWRTPAAQEPGWVNLETVDGDGNPRPVGNHRVYDKATGRLLQQGLTQQAERWPTPQAHDAQGPKTPEQITVMRAKTGAGVKNLNEEAVAWASAWPTPRASDNENRTTRAAPSHGNTHGRVLAGEAADWSNSHPHPTTSPDGTPTSERAVLNPLFVEALMGLPIGWTDCDQAVTASYQTWLRSRGASSGGE